MDTLSISSLLPIIQASTSPVILISGLGLLLLTMTNRMGRLVDRTRIYAAQLRQAGPEERKLLERRLELTWRRAKIVRLSLTFATSSMLSSAALVVTIFASALLKRDLGPVIIVLFIAAIALLVAALVAFLKDIFSSLDALRTEVQEARHT